MNKIVFGLIYSVFALGIMNNQAQGSSSDNSANAKVSFYEPNSFVYKIQKVFKRYKNDQNTVTIKFRDTKGVKIDPDKTIKFKSGSKYDLNQFKN
ncbi:hypothetical protein [Companilactobacillus sp. DQM5]|uniref:hypothetical protein n=1 Tax=Companilactobacillus sp. DQM5 TaxID=3463359 RepID=UPI0040594A55